MILGVLIRVILEFCRRRGVPVPDVSRLRRRRPRFDVITSLTGHLAATADNAISDHVSRRRARRGGAR